jgi:malate synthase
MEDLATDRIYRYMIAQRVLHQVVVPDVDGRSVTHSPELVTRLFDEELERLLGEGTQGEVANSKTLKQARDQSEGMILGILEAQGARTT